MKVVHSRSIGRLEEANVIKFYLETPRIYYLYYPDFDDNPHPRLYRAMEIDLRNLHVTYPDFDGNDDPLILHQIDSLVTPDYPQYEKFAKLTRQEDDWGLLENWRSISHLSGWNKSLEDHCAFLHGYKLSWRKDADPYKVKILQSSIRSRKNSAGVRSQESGVRSQESE
jgi:DNA phosphorothioation-associated putative methyltransferase